MRVLDIRWHRLTAVICLQLRYPPQTIASTVATIRYYNLDISTQYERLILHWLMGRHGKPRVTIVPLDLLQSAVEI